MNSNFIKQLLVSLTLLALYAAPLSVVTGDTTHISRNADSYNQVGTARPVGFGRTDRRVASAHFLLNSTVSSVADALPLARFVGTPVNVRGQMVGFGTDERGVVFARKSDGTKAKYLALSADHFKLQITKNNLSGEVEFRRLSATETFTSYALKGGNQYSVRTLLHLSGDQQSAQNVAVIFRYGDEQAVLNLDLAQSRIKDFDYAAKSNLQRIVAGVNNDRDLRSLLQEVSIFADQTVVRSAFSMMKMSFIDGLDCVDAIFACASASIGYVGAMGLLIAACGETFGLGCAGALLAHPIVAGLVATKCSKAVRACRDHSENQS